MAPATRPALLNALRNAGCCKSRQFGTFYVFLTTILISLANSRNQLFVISDSLALSFGLFLVLPRAVLRVSPKLNTVVTGLLSFLSFVQDLFNALNIADTIVSHMPRMM